MSAHDIAAPDDGSSACLQRARQELPGPPYYSVLFWIHRALKPDTYVEIGVHRGESLRMARAGTRCIGIDPCPQIAEQSAATQIFATTSDDFFASHHLPGILGRPHVELALVDGLHLFEQALRDVINLERYCDGNSVMLLHDCLPLDAVTSARVRTSEFYSGDVWKLSLCLRETRPDLQMTIVPAWPTGLCIISGFGAAIQPMPTYETCVALYRDLTFDDYRARAASMPPQIANTKAAVQAYLARIRGINGRAVSASPDER